MGFWWQKAKRVTLSLASYPHCTRSAHASGSSLTIADLLINCLVLLVTSSQMAPNCVAIHRHCNGSRMQVLQGILGTPSDAQEL